MSAPYYHTGRPVLVSDEVIPATEIAEYKAYDDMDQHKSSNVSEVNSRREGCGDAFWAILFNVHLGVIIYCAAKFAPKVIETACDSYGDNDDGYRFMFTLNMRGGQQQDFDFTIEPVALITLATVAAVFGCLFSLLYVSFMIEFSHGIIKMRLLLLPIFFGLMVLVSLAAGSTAWTIICGIWCAISSLRAYQEWDMPFPASDFVTAVTAVKANMGLVVYTYILIIILYGWTILWSIASFSTVTFVADCDFGGECANSVNGRLIFLFLVSLYWTIQVMINIVHVTVAGTVGSWWPVTEEARYCRSQAARDSFVYSMTSSFGSICFGSLILGPFLALKTVIHSMQKGNCFLMRCIAECMIGSIESINWAFVYVGLYGFSFMKAGSNVMTIFRNRGWTAIIADLTVDIDRCDASVVLGAYTGFMVVLVGSVMQLGSAGTLFAAAVLGFMIGCGISATLFSVVSGAFNAVIVCYADAPDEFEQNHPELANRMKESWRQRWPNDFSY